MGRCAQNLHASPLRRRSHEIRRQRVHRKGGKTQIEEEEINTKLKFLHSSSPGISLLYKKFFEHFEKFFSFSFTKIYSHANGRALKKF